MKILKTPTQKPKKLNKKFIKRMLIDRLEAFESSLLFC